VPTAPRGLELAFRERVAAGVGVVVAIGVGVAELAGPEPF
jgi:hypothetical protein